MQNSYIAFIESCLSSVDVYIGSISKDRSWFETISNFGIQGIHHLTFTTNGLQNEKFSFNIHPKILGMTFTNVTITGDIKFLKESNQILLDVDEIFIFKIVPGKALLQYFINSILKNERVKTDGDKIDLILIVLLEGVGLQYLMLRDF